MKDFRELAIQLCCVGILYIHNHPQEKLDNLKIDMNMIKELYERLVYNNKENLVNILFDKYLQLPKFTFNELDTPLSNTVKLEYEYKKLRENKLGFIHFINNNNKGKYLILK